MQDQNSPLTVPAVDTEQPPPKPKKFFKSRNAETFPPVPQIAYAPQQVPPLSPEHPPSFKEKKSTKKCRYNRDSSSPELPRRNSEKAKPKKTTVATKASKKEEPISDNSQPPNKRYLVRNRSKVINYAEDGSNSPIPDMTTRYESLPPKAQSPKASPLISSPVPAKPIPEVVSPSTSKESNEERKPPPIVLRISKGTSRIVSTDSNEGFTSPGSDRHSSMDMHSDFDHKKSPSMETICSPKHEGLKITIKCSSLSQENKKDKKKDKKEGHHKSHKRHHKNSDDEPLKKPSSPLPGTDTYDLYKTLASPVHEEESITKTKVDNVESQVAKSNTTNTTSKSKAELKALPEPKQSEGRSRRNRPNINYSENDDYLDVLTSKVSNKNVTKTVSDIKKDVRKSKRRLDVAAVPESNDMNEIHSETEKDAESHYDDNDLINILSGDNDKSKPANDLQKSKVNKKQKNKQKQDNSTNDIESTNLEDSMSVSQQDESHEDDEHLAEEPRSDDMDEDDRVIQEEKDGESQTEKEVDHQDRNHPDVESGSQMESQGIDSNEDLCNNTPTQSTDSAYNSCPYENSEEESQRNIADDHFKAPNGVNEPDGADDKPSVKLVITKKKGSIFKSKSLVNDNPSPLPARKRRHLYKHQWANDVSIHFNSLDMIH